jgi:hypothetical protein
LEVELPPAEKQQAETKAVPLPTDKVPLQPIAPELNVSSPSIRRSFSESGLGVFSSDANGSSRPTTPTHQKKTPSATLLDSSDVHLELQELIAKVTPKRVDAVGGGRKK